MNTKIFFTSTGFEPRLSTRWDMHKFAREAYDLGIRYIGGCCGFEAYHVRAICEEVFLVSFNFTLILMEFHFPRKIHNFGLQNPDKRMILDKNSEEKMLFYIFM